MGLFLFRPVYVQVTGFSSSPSVIHDRQNEIPRNPLPSYPQAQKSLTSPSQHREKDTYENRQQSSLNTMRGGSWHLSGERASPHTVRGTNSNTYMSQVPSKTSLRRAMGSQSEVSQSSLRKAQTFYSFLLLFFKKLLKYSSHVRPFLHLKWKIQWFWVYSQTWASHQFENIFISPQINLILLSHHPPTIPPASVPGNH